MIYLKRLLYFFCSSCKPNHSRTVRYAFPLTFVAATLLGAAVLTSSNTSYIKIATNNSQVEAGEFFTIDVLVGAHVPVNAIDIAIAFPSDQIEIDGIDTGESVITIWTEDPYVENNTVVLSGGTFRRGFEGEHLVAQINARARTDGTAKFTVDDVRLLAGDGRGTTVSITDTGYESLTLDVALAGEGDDQMTIEGTVKVGIYTDIDGNGKVDMADVLSFMKAWRTQSSTFDFNNDGRMTFVDFAIILADSFFK
ncbi:hypothetical protein N9L26_00215 [Candidatus Pacebacteria bacterium]|nr:hypothetical protein [Candidatus Paceibacterota bacterium]